MERWFDALWNGELRALIVVAHPDDEAIGAGALLPRLPDVTVAFATDGAPVDARRGLDDPERRLAYATARRVESDLALDIAGVPVERRVRLGYVDQQTPWSLTTLVRDVERLLDRVHPDVILTHPYEGGHPDHDAVAVAVAAALDRRRNAPMHLEMAYYHRADGELRTGAFLAGGPRVHERVLTPRERAAKERMLAAYHTQRFTVARFGVEVERYRRAPPIDPFRPPHPGRLHYEAKGWLDNDTFRRLAGELWELAC